MAQPETRRSGSAGREPALPPPAEQSEDLSTGQIVIIVARWLLIATGLVVTLWAPGEEVGKVSITIGVLLAVAVGNFFLHAQLLMRRPVHSGIVYAASAVDIGVITLIVGAFGGLGSTLFVYYFPALLAFALVFPLSVTLTFTLALLALYFLVSLPGAATQVDLQTMVVRLIAMLAVAVVGNRFQRIERGRREAIAAIEADRALLGRN